MALRAPDFTFGPFRERDSQILTAVVRDEDSVAIPGGSLDTMTLTLYSEHDPDTKIRDAVDVKADVSVAGVLTHTFTPGDMTIVDVDELTAYHRVLLEWTFDGGKRGSMEVRIVLRNVYHVNA